MPIIYKASNTGIPQEAEEAIQKLNGTELEGRKLVVNEAKPQQPRSGAGGGGRGDYGRNRR